MFSKNIGFGLIHLDLSVWDLLCLKDWEDKDQPVTLLINDKAVCRTGPATPGLFIIQGKNFMTLYMKDKRSTIDSISLHAIECS